MNDELTGAVNSIKRRLIDFTPAGPAAPDLIWKQSANRIFVERHQFPVPAFVLFLLHGVCGFPLGRRGEKTHWVVPFCYKGVQCAISYEKFGIHFYLDEIPKHRVDAAEILGKLKKAGEASEKSILAKMAQMQIKSGNITIANQFPRFRDVYDYFRNRAVECFKSPKQENVKEGMDGLVEALNTNNRAMTEGVYNALAMIEAYFSCLEHFLVLALPFASFDRKSDNLSTFVGGLWSEKMRRVLPWTDPKTQAFYSRLVSIKEKYRNTFAHGGFEKKGASFYFHLPPFGAIPASMSGHRDSVHFNFFPLEQSSFREVCNLFDEFDGWLRKEALPLAWKFAERGLSLRFDQSYLEELFKASIDEETYNKWIERESYYADMYSNADY